MPRSLRHDVPPVLAAARTPGTVRVRTPSGEVEVPSPYPSPADWRDVWIYFLLVDRFDNPAGQPRSLPWDGSHGTFQGGTLAGVRRRLPYLRDLGAGAVWLSPVLENPQFDDGAYHGYGIQDFLAVEPRFTSDPERARRDPGFADAELRALVDEAHALGLHVILDIVLNHAGDVFEYVDGGSVGRFTGSPRPIRWRDEHGVGRPEWSEAPDDPPAGAAVWPAELRRNACFRRQGNAFDRPDGLIEHGGDFLSLKELDTSVRDGEGHRAVRSALISAYQYAIAKFDVDGFRIDTLKFVEPDFAKTFGNATREYALGIGKKNFFTFGEVYDDEEKIARFIGRRATEPGDVVGVDAALDFPLFYRLAGVVKGIGGLSPADLVGVFEHRKRVQQGVVSSHGEASRYFVTFLDNHDQTRRFHYADPADPHRYDAQSVLGLALLFFLQGVPCLYYGTESGLHGAGERDWAVREALWGAPHAFDPGLPLAAACRRLSELRRSWPELRYGRQYFRPISGDGAGFGISTFPGGVVALSRILNDREVLVVANTSTTERWSGEVIVDRDLNQVDAKLAVAFSNLVAPSPPEPVAEKAKGTVRVAEVGGGVTDGPLRVVRVALDPMELQVLVPTQ